MCGAPRLITVMTASTLLAMSSRPVPSAVVTGPVADAGERHGKDQVRLGRKPSIVGLQ